MPNRSIGRSLDGRASKEDICAKMAPSTINGWESPKFITQYNKTIDETELEIRTYESQRKFEGRIEDNRNPNNWLEIFYDHELDKWRYMVPGKLPDASTKRGALLPKKLIPRRI
jgi:hypothetical protein